MSKGKLCKACKKRLKAAHRRRKRFNDFKFWIDLILSIAVISVHLWAISGVCHH